MKGQFGNESPETPEDDTLVEVWTEEMFRKRSEELNLIDAYGNRTNGNEFQRNASRCEDISLLDLDQSPSKSTTSESQVSTAIFCLTKSYLMKIFY